MRKPSCLISLITRFLRLKDLLEESCLKESGYGSEGEEEGEA
jgi:hypothetical protein